MISSVAGAVISLLLLVISVFLKRLLMKFDEMNTILGDVVTKSAIQTTSCKFTHVGIDARLNSHSSEIKEIKEQLKTKK